MQITDLIDNNLEHIFALIIFMARVGDIAATYMATPTLKLELNPIVRRFGMKFAPVGFALCLMPYWNLGYAIQVIVPLVLVAADNFASVVGVRKGWGEDEYLKGAIERNRRQKPAEYLLFGVASRLHWIVVAIILGYFDTSDTMIASDFAVGLVNYAFITWAYDLIGFFRLRRLGRETASATSLPKHQAGCPEQPALLE